MQQRQYSSVKNILFWVCLFSLALGYPVPDSDSDSSQNIKNDSWSSESRLKSSEQDDSSEEAAIDHQTDELSGRLHIGHMGQNHVSAPIDSIDIEEQLTSTEDEKHSREGDKEKETTGYTNGKDEEVEHEESGSHEDKFKNMPVISENDGHSNEGSDNVAFRHVDHKNSGDNVKDEDNKDEASDVDEGKAHTNDDNDQIDDYEDNISVKVVDSRETDRDCNDGDNENSKNRKTQTNFISQDSYEANVDKMQNDDSNTDTRLNTDVSSVSSEKQEKTSNIKKLKKVTSKKSKHNNKAKGKNLEKTELSDSDLHSSKSAEKKQIPEKHGSLKTRESKTMARSDSQIERSHSNEDIASKEEKESSEDTNSPEDIQSPEDTSSPEGNYSPEDTNSPEDIQSPEDTNSPEDLHSNEDNRSKEGNKQLKMGTSYAAEHLGTSDEDVTQSKEDITKSAEGNTDSEENVSKSKGIITQSHSESKETLQMKTVNEIKDQSVSEEDQHHGKSTEEKSESTEHTNSKENSKYVESIEHDSKLEESDATLEQASNSESEESHNSSELRSMALANSTDSNSSTKSTEEDADDEHDSDSKEEPEQEHDSVSSDMDHNKGTMRAGNSGSWESHSKESEESIEIRHQSESSESEDVSRASVSSEIDSRRLMFDIYHRKAIGNDNDCQDGY